MRQEALETVFATYVSQGKWNANDVPKILKKNVDNKVKKLKKEKGGKKDV